jgi:transcriptional regulator GlxA family with amidase domain
VLPRDGRSRSRAYRRVHEACVVMSTHLDERMTISAVADSVGLSAFHFCRQFRAVTGLTVHAYRERLRLRHAFSTCASAPNQKLSDVALEAGYASHSHMTTSFRAMLRMSPSGVRDRYALDAAKTGIGEQPFSFR